MFVLNLDLSENRSDAFLDVFLCLLSAVRRDLETPAERDSRSDFEFLSCHICFDFLCLNIQATDILSLESYIYFPFFYFTFLYFTMLFRVIRWLYSGYNLVITRKEGTNPPSSESSGGGLSRVSFRRVLLGSGGCPKSRGVLDCVQATVLGRVP